MRRLIAATATTGLLLALATAAGAAVTQTTAASCVIPKQSAVEDKPTPQRARSQKAKAAVGKKINEDFTRFGPDNPTGQLERGYIGGVSDRDDQVTIVVDPERVDSEKFQAEASQAAADALAKDPDNVAPLIVKVQSGCFSADELLEAMNVLLARDWHPRAAKVSLVYFLDPHDSTFHVFLAKEDGDVADALKKRLGDRVTIEEGTVENSSGAGSTRRNDVNAHYGGAPITAGGAAFGAASFCTAGFTVNKGPLFPAGSSGTRGVLSAGHCYDDGNSHTVWAGSATGTPTSTRQFGVPFGETASPLSLVTDGTVITPVPGFDAATFTNRIYTNPRLNLGAIPDPNAVPAFAAIQSKPVVGTFEVLPLVSDLVCYSGRVDGNVCNNSVFPTPIAICALDPDTTEGCVVGARITQQLSGFQAVGPDGDSGGPVYVCVTDASDILPNSQSNNGCDLAADQASAVGTIVGKLLGLAAIPFGGVANSVFAPILDQELAYNVTVAITP